MCTLAAPISAAVGRYAHRTADKRVTPATWAASAMTATAPPAVVRCPAGPWRCDGVDTPNRLRPRRLPPRAVPTPLTDADNLTEQIADDTMARRAAMIGTAKQTASSAGVRGVITYVTPVTDVAACQPSIRVAMRHPVPQADIRLWSARRISATCDRVS